MYKSKYIELATELAEMAKDMSDLCNELYDENERLTNTLESARDTLNNVWNNTGSIGAKSEVDYIDSVLNKE